MPRENSFIADPSRTKRGVPLGDAVPRLDRQIQCVSRRARHAAGLGCGNPPTMIGAVPVRLAWLRPTTTATVFATLPA